VRVGSVFITGQAYQRRATLEVNGDALTWRAQRGQLHPIRENVVTTVHDIRDVRWLEYRWSMPGAILAVLAVLWMVSDGLPWAAGMLAVAVALTVWRRTHPRLILVLELSDRRLILRVALDSEAAANALVDRIDRALATGETPLAPSALP
jgi:hypothetical protein